MRNDAGGKELLKELAKLSEGVDGQPLFFTQTLPEVNMWGDRRGAKGAQAAVEACS